MNTRQKSEEKKFSLETKPDIIVEMVRADLRERSKKGQETYGTTLAENDADDFLQHAYEEALDLALYLKKLQTQKQK